MAFCADVGKEYCFITQNKTDLVYRCYAFTCKSKKVSQQIADATALACQRVFRTLALLRSRVKSLAEANAEVHLSRVAAVDPDLARTEELVELINFEGYGISVFMGCGVGEMGPPHRRNLTNHFFSRLPSVGTDGNHAGTPTPTRSFERTCWRWQGQPETTYHTRRRGCLAPTAPASAHSSERPTPTNTNERDSSTRRHHAAVPASRFAANHPGASDDTSELHGCSLGWKEPPPVHVRLSPRHPRRVTRPIRIPFIVHRDQHRTLDIHTQC